MINLSYSGGFSTTLCWYCRSCLLFSTFVSQRFPSRHHPHFRVRQPHLFHRRKQMIIARTLSRLIQSLSFFGFLVSKLTRHGKVFYRQTSVYILSTSIIFQKHSLNTVLLEQPMCAHLVKRVFHLFCKRMFITMFTTPLYIELYQSSLRLISYFSTSSPKSFAPLLLFNWCLLFHPRHRMCVTFRIMFMPLDLLFSTSTAFIFLYIDCPSGPRPPSFWGFETKDTPHFVGRKWTSDRPEAETSTWQHKTFSRERLSCRGGI